MSDFPTTMADLRGKTVAVKCLWTGGSIHEDVYVDVDEDGKITHIGSAPKAVTTLVELKNQILIPGFVNSHSHAFHRFLRGRSELGKSAADTFWKWRDNMYELVADVGKGDIYKYCLTTFKEMINAGITTVGEFHYVHHSSGRFDLDEAVLQAAVDAGIRIVLLQTLYEKAGFADVALHPVQERFVSTYDEFLESVQKLRTTNYPNVSIGVAAHSTRAVPFENIEKLYNFAHKEKLPFHIHLEEQPKEILDCQRFLGTKETPSDVLLNRLQIDETFTAVHATFTSKDNQSTFAKLGANISVCPCTEGYLGDGFPRLVDSSHVSFGTDCNNRISFIEEMRWACFSQQMINNSRSVNGFTADKLLTCATSSGARSLGLSDSVGSFEVGKFFDAVAFTLDSPLLSNCNSDQLIDAIVFGCGNREISSVFVAGRNRKD